MVSKRESELGVETRIFKALRQTVEKEPTYHPALGNSDHSQAQFPRGATRWAASLEAGLFRIEQEVGQLQRGILGVSIAKP